MTNPYWEACGVFLKTLAEKNIPASRLVEGLSIGIGDLQDPKSHVTAKVFQDISERFARALADENGTQPRAAPDATLAQNASLDASLMNMPWREMLQNIALPVLVCDTDGTICYVNRVAPEWTVQDVIGRTIFDVIPSTHREIIRKCIEQVKRSGTPRIEAIPYTLPDHIAWYENQFSPLFRGDDIIGIIAVSRDISDLRKAQLELHKRAVQLDIVAEISAQIKSTLDLSQLIQNLCDTTRASFGLYHVHVYLVDKAEENLVIRAGSGEIGRRIVQTRHTLHLAPGEKGLVVQAALGRRIVVSNDVLSDPHFLYNPYLPDTRSEMSIPIILDTRLIGILDVQSSEVGYFTPEDEAVQQILADQIAISIRNAQLYEDIHRQWEIASSLRDIALVLTSSRDMQEILQRTLKETKRLIPYDAASIWLKDDEGKLRVAASIGYQRFGVAELTAQLALDIDTTPLLAKMNQDKQVVIISDAKSSTKWGPLPGYEWIRSWAAAPILVRGELIGRMALDHTQVGFYDDDYRYVLEVLSREISLAVENVYLLESERLQRELAETLRDIGLVLTSSLEQDDILQLVLAQVARVLPYSAAGVWLDDGTGTFWCVASFGYEEFNAADRIKDLRFELDDGLSFLHHESAIIISDTHQAPEWNILEGFEWIRSWASAPIVVRGQLIGQISLDHAEPGFYRVKKHKAILESLVTQVSLAVGNAQLFEAERRRRQELEALQRGNMSLTASLELSPVFDAILSATIELFPARDALIFLYENGELIYSGGMNSHREHLRENPIRTPLRKDGLTYTVAKSGESLIIEDIQNHPLYRNYRNARLIGMVGIIGIALKIADRVVGVMTLAFESGSDVRKVDMKALQSLANQASIAIENARLYKAVQDHAVQLESRVEMRTAELVQERAQLQTILDGMAEGVIFDVELEVKYVNQILNQLTGFRLDRIRRYEVLLTRILAPSIDAKQMVSEIYDTVSKKGSWRRDVRMRRQAGGEFDASLLVRAVKAPDNSISGAVTIIRDISQEKALQTQKDRFISHASHELRTPITNLQTRLYLLRKRPEKMEEHLRVIEDVTEQMAMLAAELLDISRFERGVIETQREWVILQDVIEQVIYIQQAEADHKHISLNSELPSEPIRISLDATRITQVFTNLITNAINYTENGGTVIVKLYVDGQQKMVVVEVQDNGVGIAPRLLPQVFEPFFRAREGMAVGSGLGLSISREIVEAHGGTLTVQSEENKGSTFTVRLPRVS